MKDQEQHQIETAISEIHGRIITDFRKNHTLHVNLLQEIESMKNEVKETVPDAVWRKLRRIFKSVELQTYIESEYLFVQGMVHYQKISHRLNNEFIDAAYNLAADFENDEEEEINLTEND